MTRQQFTKLVNDALSSLPNQFACKLDNVAIIIKDYPTQEQIVHLGSPFYTSLFGLYEGVSQPKRGSGYSMVIPDKITIFQRPIERICRTSEDVKHQVKKTVLHEIAHHFGMNESEIGKALQ